MLELKSRLVRSFNALPNGVKREVFYAARYALDQRGVFATTNKLFANPESAWNPTCHKELADQTSTANTDTTIVGNKWGRIRIIVKSGMANTNTVIFVVRVGTGATVVAPEVVATSPTLTFTTGDGLIMWDAIFFSQNGFQSWKVASTNSGGAAVYDILFDAT